MLQRRLKTLGHTPPRERASKESKTGKGPGHGRNIRGNRGRERRSGAIE